MVSAGAARHKALFRRAASGLLKVFRLRAPKGRDKKIRLRLQMPDLDALLGAWLNEVVYLVSSGKIVPQKFVIEEIGLNKNGARLCASITGFKPGRGLKMREIKAVALHGLQIKKRGGRLQVSFITDI